jgi:3-dehydroquinate synthase
MSRKWNEAGRVRVSTPLAGEHEYDVVVRAGLLEEAGAMIGDVCPAHRYAVISDTRVAEHYGERLSAALSEAGLGSTLFTFPAGEWNKTREIWSELTDRLLRAGFGRDSAVIALGGGVAGDLAAFVAATYMRGVPVVQIPTTLLAMLDSSVGGKSGVDTAAGKNLVGAFHQPSLVLVDPSLLSTLSRPQFVAGLAEAFKHGAIKDVGYFEWLVAGLERVVALELEALAALVVRSVEIKAEVVGRDERESGYRRILNFGHTVAHAQETVSGYGWLHGEAVAAGMVMEAAIGESLGVTRAGTTERLREVLSVAGLPVELEEGLDADRFMKAMAMDKKREGGRSRFTLIAEIGEVAGSASAGWTHEVADETVRTVLFG